MPCELISTVDKTLYIAHVITDRKDEDAFAAISFTGSWELVRSTMQKSTYIHHSCKIIINLFPENVGRVIQGEKWILLDVGNSSPPPSLLPKNI